MERFGGSSPPHFQDQQQQQQLDLNQVRKRIQELTYSFHQHLYWLATDHQHHRRKKNALEHPQNHPVVVSPNNAYQKHAFSTNDKPSSCLDLVLEHALDHLPAITTDPSPTIDNPAEVLACRSCGTLVYPGWNQTSLRVARSVISKSSKRRTLARRHQRKQKRAAARISNSQVLSTALKRSGSTTAANTNSTTTTATAFEKNTRHVSVVLMEPKDTTTSKNGPVSTRNDFRFDRHHIVITCGTCKDKTCWKGVKRPKHQVEQAEEEDAIFKLKSASKSSSRLDHQEQRWDKPKPLPRNDSTSNEFIALPPKSHPQAQQQQQPKRLLLQNNTKKKKKRKESSQPKSKLMEFLSTLND